MKLTTLTLILLFAVGVSAQETSTATTTTTTAAEAATSTGTTPATTTDTAEAAPEPNSYEIRNQFTVLLREDHPPELPMIVKLDPSLLTNDAFLAGYPQVARFIEKYPEIRRNPRFYLADFPYPGAQPVSAIHAITEMMAVMSGFGLALFALMWLVRTVIEQRRWNRLSRTQSEVHNKIIDRFGSADEVLAYIQSAAGTKFLESAPIPLQAEKPSQGAPFTRVMWSIQLGVAIAVAAFGVVLVSLRYEGETAHGLFAMGMIAFSVGAGFVASALVSLAMSRRLGLWQGPAGAAAVHDADDPGLVR